MGGPQILVTVTGRDAPGVAAALFEALAALEAAVVDVEQVEIHGRLLLGILLEDVDPTAVAAMMGAAAEAAGVAVDVETIPAPTADDGRRTAGGPHHVTVLAPTLGPVVLSGVFRRIADCGANVDRIVRLSSYPVVSYELDVTGGDAEQIRRSLSEEAAQAAIDIAVQAGGLYRRAKRLIVLDVDSTLIRDEVIDLLAAEAGCEADVARITAEAMAGRLEFEAALRQRVALLKGLDADRIDAVRRRIRLTPGARTLVRTLHRLGYVVALVSGGFAEVIDAVAAELGIGFTAANTLQVTDGRLTGELAGPVVDRAGKAAALERFAAAAGVPLSQTVAVGDGANDLDMLARAGLGIAFNAKPVLRAAADATISVPYLDAILFLLGLTREEIEAADTGS